MSLCVSLGVSVCGCLLASLYMWVSLGVCVMSWCLCDVLVSVSVSLCLWMSLGVSLGVC